MREQDLKNWLFFIRDEIICVRHSMRERGAKYFIRPLLISGVCAYASYSYVYLPPGDEIRAIEQRIGAARAISKYAKDYADLSSRLEELHANLPKDDDIEGWLLNSVRSTLRDEGIVPLATTSPVETVGDIYRQYQITVNCQASYAQFASWISRLERGKSLLIVQRLGFEKDPKPIGSNSARVTIMTMVPLERRR